MSLKAYSKYTLNGAWFEERSAPLNGVIADYKTKNFTSTTRSTYVAPKKETLRKQTKGMISREAFFFRKLSERQAGPKKFGMSAVKPVDDKLHCETSHHAEFGRPSNITGDQSLPPHERRPAGGHPSYRPERPMRTSGAIGEVYNSSTEPQHSTPAQRSWLYSLAPELKAREFLRNQAAEVGDQDLPKENTTNSSEDKKYYSRKITFGITAEHSDLYRVGMPIVFQDDLLK